MDSSNLRYESSSSPRSSGSCYESISLSGTTTSEFINRNCMIRDWTGGNNESSTSHDSDNDLNLAKIKENQLALSEYSFTEMLNNPASSSSFRDLSDISEKLLLQTISPDFSMFSAVGCRAGNFSQIYPSINISNLNNIQPPSSMNNFQALDLLSPPPRFSRSHSFPSPPFSEYMHQSSRATINNLNQIPSLFGNEITDQAKRSPASSLLEPKATQAAAKKSRVEPRSSSCPPMKVRKEKLGDRIAALQQLVAPYGKTDTASVLMEAIGYIKFLQNQVETLSVPYMKSNYSKRSDQEPRRELRSRGLCLVPLSCMSYITGDGRR